MNHDHCGHDCEPKGFWRSRYGGGLLVLGAIAAYFLLIEHRAHVFAALPLLLLMYYGRLAITEAAEMRARFGEAYERYAGRTPRFFPRWGQASSAG